MTADHELVRLQPAMRTYAPSDEVDFVIVGSGAAGGVMARELSRNGEHVLKICRPILSGGRSDRDEDDL